MTCRGKALQWAALPLLVLASLVLQTYSAAVHRADGVDAATARLLGRTDDSVVSQAALPSSGSADPGAYFAPDSWRPVWRDMAERRSSSSRQGGAPVQDLFISGPRTFRADKLGESDDIITQRSLESGEVVITPRPIKFSSVVPPVVADEKPEQRSSEVQDSIAAVANQLLATQDVPILDVRTPPRMQQQQTKQEATATPSSIIRTTVKDSDAEWSLVATNNSPLRITTIQSVSKPITKVPPISKLSTPMSKLSTPAPKVPSTTSKNNIAISTRFPPRKPSIVVTEQTNIITKSKTPVVEITTKKTVTHTVTTPKRTVVEITTKKPSTVVTVMMPTKKPEVLATTTKKPATSVYKRPPSTPVAVTILKKTNSSITATITATTPGRPIIPITERIPTTSTRTPPITPAPITYTKVEKLSNSYSKVSDVSSPPLFEKITTSVKVPSASVKIPSSNIKLTTFIPSTTKMVEVTTTTTAAAPVTPEVTTPAPVSSTTKRTRRPTKKKNKNRRRRPAKPSTPKPEETLETKEGEENLNGLIKPNKPLSTRIYQFISRDVMPNFGMGIMGILVTAGLAGLLLLPIDGFTRRSDVYKREEEEGIIPSVIQAVMTSLNIGEQKYEEQGPRRYKRQAMNENEIMESDVAPPFSFMRFVKQVLAIKLDIVSNMLRVASEALRNYAQNGPQGTHDRPESTTPEDEKTMVEVSTVSAETEVVPEETTVEITTQQNSEENEEENFVRRRTNL